MPHPRYPFLLTTLEAAQVLEVKRARLYELVASGKLFPIQFHRQLYFHVLDLMRYIASRAEMPSRMVEEKLLKAMGLKAHLIISGENGDAVYRSKLFPQDNKKDEA